MRVVRVEIALGSTLAVVAVVSIVIIVHQHRRVTEYQTQHARDQQSLVELRETLRLHELRKAPPEAGNPGPAPNEAALAKREAVIAQLDRDLAAARANLSDLQAQLSSSQDDRERAVKAADDRHDREQQDWQNQLTSLKQQLDSVEASSQASRQRILALEADNEKLRTATSGRSARAADLNRLITNLQDLDHRRESYLTSIMHRYRDITSQFRAMSGMLDTGRDPNSGAFSEAALTRIENAVSSTDDDLRQLNELDAQVHRVQEKLAKQ